MGYITGILPIKKIKDESALNNFEEYTMLKSKPITKYYGFTEEEVKKLCKKYDMDFESAKAWYNGYLIDGMHMYNPNSVSMALMRQDFDSYWKNTSSFASIIPAACDLPKRLARLTATQFFGVSSNSFRYSNNSVLSTYIL